jgi:hypothetical protein
MEGWDPTWPYEVRLYQPKAMGGRLMLFTRHRTEASRDVEVAASLKRRERGEVGRIEVISCGEPAER